MEAGLDTGPVLACESTTIRESDTGSSLHDRLSVMGSTLLASNLEAIRQRTLVPQPQDDALATYAHKLHKAEAMIDWQDPAQEIARKVQAFNSWPIAETRLEGRQLRIWEARAVATHTEAVPGTVLSAGKDGITVACGSGVLHLLHVQLPGARAVSAADFVNAHAIKGIRLGGDG